ncbi:TPA: phage morphogenesis protein, partial [Pasteurella multocida]|nr:phage morphogenesis protein [Pasteurella multocida]
LTQIAARQDLTQRAKFDEVLRTIDQIDEIPTILVTGKNASANRKANLKSLTSALSERDTREINAAMQLACTAALMKIATDFIEDDTMLPSDIEYIATKVRLQILKNLNTVRAFAQEVTPSFTVTMPNTGIYTKSHLVSERLRNQGKKITKLALSAINRKPPLVIRTVEINGTLQQVAHEFYGDYRRANELLRLNPQIRYPNFITKGEVLNSYAK